MVSAPLNTSVKDRIPRNVLSQLPDFLNKTYTFDVPVYTVWGACEDVQVLEKLRSGEYKIDKLHIIDEAHSKLLEVGGLKLRLLGLGGAVVMHKLFDNGEGKTTIAGGQGTMWTTLLQMGELIDTANHNYDPSETRILITHASPAREGLLNQLSVTLKVDFSISAGLHFRYGSSYNEFSVNPTLDHYRGKLAASRASFMDVWETVKSEVEPAVAENEMQHKLLKHALDLVEKMPSVANGGNPFGGQIGADPGHVDEMAFKNMWNFNLADAAFGLLVLEVEGGRIATEMRAQGFNFAHRGMKNPVSQADMIKPSAPSPSVAGAPVSNMPAPQHQQFQQQQQAPAQSTSQPRTSPPSNAAPPPAGYQAPRQGQPQRQQSAQHAPAGRVAEPSTSSTPQTTQPQQQPSKPPGGAPASARPAPSPAPSASTQSAKPATPQAPGASSTAPPPAATNGQKDTVATESKVNGGINAEPAGDGAAKETPPPQRITDGIFVTNVGSEDELRAIFSDEDKAKIQRIEKRGPGWIAHFASPEEATAVLDSASAELKGRMRFGKPNIKRAYDKAPLRHDSQNTWGASSRGDRQQTSYRGGATGGDGDGGRGGRGTFRGRGRGTERGRGRGGRGGFGRGGEGEGGSAAPAATPAPAAAASSST